LWGFNEKKKTRGREKTTKPNEELFKTKTTTTGFFELFRQKRADA